MSEESTVPVPARAQRPPPAEELPPGTRAGEYVIQGLIAAGGCGTVYAAHDRVSGKRAAVKVLHRDLAYSSEMTQRFLREAQVVTRIRHPGIVDIYEVGELQDGRPFLVMELLQGTSLARVLHRRGRFVPREALALLEPVGRALQAAHEAGVVHRDIKGSNVLVVREGERPEVKLIDFGIAKLTQPDPETRNLTAVGQRIGTPSTMSPEQIRGVAVDARADVYALGVLLFQLLTGRTPFVADDSAEMERLHLECPPPRPSTFAPLSAGIDSVLLRCLEKDPARRFPSVAAMMDAFRGTVENEPPAGDVRDRPAGAIYVELTLADEDDALLDALSETLDAIEREVIDAGFYLNIQTGTALLAVRPFAAGDAREERSALVRFARDLFARRRGLDPRLQISVQVHAAPVTLRETPDGPTFTGGAALALDTWVTQGPGFHATPAALDGVEPR